MLRNNISEPNENTTQSSRQVRKPVPAQKQESVWVTLEQLSAEIGAKWHGSSDINDISCEERSSLQEGRS